MPEVARQAEYVRTHDAECPECGEEIWSQDNFCGWCGTDLRNREDF